MKNYYKVNNMIYNGVVVEGTSEKAIVDLLIENDLLKFKRDTLLFNTNDNDEIVFASLNPKKYCADYLGHAMEDDSVVIHVVLDNDKKLDFAKYSADIVDVQYYITKPEIEAIHLYNDPSWHAQYQKYRVTAKRSNLNPKPSEYFKAPKSQNGLGIKNIKKYEYVHNLWSNNILGLVNAIQQEAIQQNKKHPNNLTLADLLKE